MQEEGERERRTVLELAIFQEISEGVELIQ